MAQGSRGVVYAALAGNLAIAVIKFVAFGLSGSTAMFTEGVHSVVDTGDQLLLLMGLSRSARPADQAHPFGYGMELYFWAFVVALLIFSVGGAVSIWEGVGRLLHPEPARTVWVNYAVLGFSALFEGYSFTVGWREYKRVAPDGVGVVRFIRRSKDPSLFTSLLEDGAALTGLAIAAAGVGASQLGLLWADGAASIGIGLLLVVIALVLANETRGLIAGEAAAPRVVESIREALVADPRVSELVRLRPLQLGPRSILVAAELRIEVDLQELGDALDALASSVRARDSRIVDVFLRPTRGVPIERNPTGTSAEAQLPCDSSSR